jgi:DNA-binding transcriptional LysR family regulator
MTLEIIEGIEAEKYDVGFCSYVENKPKLQFHPILAQELILLVNNKHPLARKKSIRLNELSGFKLITYRQSLPIGKTIRHYLMKNQLKALYAYDDEISIGGVVATTDNAAITARTPFLHQFQDLKMIKLDIPLNARLIYLVLNKESYHTLHVKSFVNYILQNECHLPE